MYACVCVCRHRVPGVNFTSTQVVRQDKPRQEDRQSRPHPVIAAAVLNMWHLHIPDQSITFNQDISPPSTPFLSQPILTLNKNLIKHKHSVKNEGALSDQAMKLKHHCLTHN